MWSCDSSQDVGAGEQSEWTCVLVTLPWISTGIRETKAVSGLSQRWCGPAAGCRAPAPSARAWLV